MNLTVEVYSIKDAMDIIGSGVKSIVINNVEDLFYGQESKLVKLINLKKIVEKNKKVIILRTPHIIHEKEFAIISKNIFRLMEKGLDSFAISNTGILGIILEGRYKENTAINIYLNYMMNIFNHKAVLFFKDLINKGAGIILKDIMPSSELTLKEITQLIGLSHSAISHHQEDFEFSVYSYGYYPVMESRFKMEYFIKNSGNKNINKIYDLIDKKNYRFIIEEDYNGNLIFLNSKKLCNFFELPSFYESGIKNLYIDTRTFDIKQIKNILEFYNEASDKISKGKIDEYSNLADIASKNILFSNYTKGHFFREVI
jgi:collagenase-like PrtC family protease